MARGAGLVALIAILVPAVCQEGAPVRPLHVYDLEGRLSNPFDLADGKPVVFLFTRSDCPISNRYAPEVQRLHQRFSNQAVFLLVYVDPDESEAAIRGHLHEYGYTMRALRDPRHELVHLAGVRVTPEAAVFAPGRQLLYRGRIDNRYVDFGQRRPEPSSRDLEAALEAIAQGNLHRTVVTEAVGCFISDLQ